jgi:hypothetical protein
MSLLGRIFGSNVSADGQRCLMCGSKMKPDHRVATSCSNGHDALYFHLPDRTYFTDSEKLTNSLKSKGFQVSRVPGGRPDVPVWNITQSR